MIVKYCKYANLSIVPCDCFVLNIYSFNKTNANVSDRVPSVITKYILVTVIFNRALISVPLKLDFKHITVINRWKTYKKLWTTLFQICVVICRCSRYKYRGARAWRGWARRGDRAYGTITDITIPHWNGRNSKGCRQWWEGSKRWWSRRRGRGPPRRPSVSVCRPAYGCQMANMDEICIYSYESLISKPS